MNSGDAAQRDLDPEDLEKAAGGGRIGPLSYYVKCEYAYTSHCNSWCYLFNTFSCIDGYYDPHDENLRRPF